MVVREQLRNFCRQRNYLDKMVLSPAVPIHQGKQQLLIGLPLTQTRSYYRPVEVRVLDAKMRQLFYFVPQPICFEYPAQTRLIRCLSRLMSI